MDAETIARLNEINREFYARVAADFDATRQSVWPGWARVLAHLPGKRPLAVLDAGCGNGRFGVFLAENLTGAIRYHGVDNNAALLERARVSLAGHAQITPTLTAADIVMQAVPSGAYDGIALFGVIHHIPGADRRRALLCDLAARLNPGGLLAFAAWRFLDVARFRDRVVAWPDDLRDQVEAGDVLLDWRRGETALRYCHFVDDEEHAALIAATGLAVVDDYRADGASGDLNRYSVLRRE